MLCGESVQHWSVSCIIYSLFPVLPIFLIQQRNSIRKKQSQLLDEIFYYAFYIYQILLGMCFKTMKFPLGADINDILARRGKHYLSPRCLAQPLSSALCVNCRIIVFLWFILHFLKASSSSRYCWSGGVDLHSLCFCFR